MSWNYHFSFSTLVLHHKLNFLYKNKDMVWKILMQQQFFLLSPSFFVFFLYWFQSPSLITDSQSRDSISLIFLLLLQYFLCSCVVHTGAKTSLHCATGGSSVPMAGYCQHRASLCWWFTVLNRHTKYCCGNPAMSMGHTL